MKINVYLVKGLKDEYASLKLGASFDHDKETICNLNIDFKRLYAFTNSTSGIAFDFFLIGAIIYGTDTFISREKNSVDGWSRILEVAFPVESPDSWTPVKDLFEQTLNFLTGDYWHLTFNKRPVIDFYKQRRPKIINKNEFSMVSLFSGGLDSLVGTTDILSDNVSQKIVLASHYDGNISGVSNDQYKLIEKLNSEFSDKFHWIQTCVFIRNTSESQYCDGEITFRSRSILFLGIGIFIANSISESTKLIMPENGTIAINHPLTPSRSSSCSTRTSHPHFLSQIQKILSSVGINNIIENPYEFKTKGEIIEKCANREFLIKSFEDSCSCAKRKHRFTWDRMTGTNHCGVCMPCLYRRAALNKINRDTEIYGTDIFNTEKSVLDIPDLPAFFDFLNSEYSIEDIEKNILVNGTLPLNKLREYAKVVERTRLELKEWITTKGNAELKKLSGIC